MNKPTDINDRLRTALKILAPIAIALFSWGVLYWLWESKMGWLESSISFIDESRNDVLKLIAAATGTSTVISFMPGDAASPIATELAQLGDLFLISLCSLYVEKFLAVISGRLVFRILVPIACGVHLMGTLVRKEAMQQLTWKIAAFALALLLVIPAGVGISTMLKDEYSPAINNAISTAELVDQSVGDDRNEEGAGNGLSAILKNLQAAGEAIAGGTAGLVDYLKDLLGYFVDSLAIMLVISCIIPLLVMMFLFWVLKMLFNVDPLRRLGNLNRFGKDPKTPLKGEEAHAEQRELAGPAE